MPNPPAQEDMWAYGEIGTPFPENAVRAMGELNNFVALWYKHGRPIHGRAWNNGGVIECSFPYDKIELTGKRDLGGMIQVLQYKGDHRNLGYWYNWVKYTPDFPNVRPGVELVRCGNSFPILWKDRPQGALLGYWDVTTKIAHFSHDKKEELKKESELLNMYMIIRELAGGPPTCDCTECHVKPPEVRVRVVLDEWRDFRAGDPWPADGVAIKALGRSLNTLPGENPDQYVALWYQSGEPVMGRIWNDKGRIAASFGCLGHEYSQNIGSMQILNEMPDRVRGFDYAWKPFKEAARFDAAREWIPVHVETHKGSMSPAVIIFNGKEILGKADIRNERASFGLKGEEKVFTGPAVHTSVVLCRKARPGCKIE